MGGQLGRLTERDVELAETDQQAEPFCLGFAVLAVAVTPALGRREQPAPLAEAEPVDIDLVDGSIRAECYGAPRLRTSCGSPSTGLASMVASGNDSASSGAT
jgi:hypothetical protein